MMTALLLVPVLAGSLPVFVLPTPRFNAPAHAPTAASAEFKVLSSKYVGVSTVGGGLEFGHLNGRRLSHRRAEKTKLWGTDGASYRYAQWGQTVFDFDKYTRPPRIKPGEGEFVYEEAVWARETGGVLYVETAHSTYASSSYGLNAYLNAVDVRTHKLLWRSPALVANAQTFVLLNDVAVTGYGFTQEPDYLYAISRENGHVVGRLALPNAPERIIRRGNTLFVRTYDHALTVRLTG
jgi:hypothetical protein